MQVVDGNRLMNTPYDLSFRADRDHVTLCSKQLTQSEITKFRKVHHPMVAATISLFVANKQDLSMISMYRLPTPSGAMS